MLQLDSTEIRFAIKAARQAALLIQAIQSEMVNESLTKGDRSPVTIADFAAQALVAHLLRSTFPEASLVAEESSTQLQTPEGAETLAAITKYLKTRLQKVSREQTVELIDIGTAEPGNRFWTLDPIDGTKGFLRGDQYAVALALLEGGQVQIAVLACPNLTNADTPEVGGAGSLLIASRGEGTWTTDLNGPLNFKQIKVSDTADPAQARFLRSFESGHTNVSHIDLITGKMAVHAEPVLMDSQAKYAVLAAGGGDLILRLLSPKALDYKEKIWDQAAGSLICEEAGGKITDLDGKPLDFTQGRTLTQNRGVLASNRKLHGAALQAIKDVGA